MVFHYLQKAFFSKKAPRTRTLGDGSEAADRPAVQQLAGNADLFRQGHTGVLDELDELVGGGAAQRGGVLPVGHQLGLDHPGKVDAVVAHH